MALITYVQRHYVNYSLQPSLREVYAVADTAGNAESFASGLYDPGPRQAISKLPAKHYELAAKLDEAAEVLDVMLAAHHQLPEVLQPGEQPVDIPASAVSTQSTHVLRQSFAPIGAMRSYKVNAVHRQVGVHSFAIIGTISNQSIGGGCNEPLHDSVSTRVISCGLAGAV